MAGFNRGTSDVNAGSMADIAFLLLIFFLVTATIETDSGLDRKLPPITTTIKEKDKIKKKNILQVVVNAKNQLLVDEQLVQLADIKILATSFLDNGGGKDDKACAYCQGSGDPASSDNPNIAVISLQNDRKTKYSTYIAVQNELVAAYNQLRNRESLRLFKMRFVEMTALYNDPYTSKKLKAQLKSQIEEIRKLFPQKISEAEPRKI